MLASLIGTTVSAPQPNLFIPEYHQPIEYAIPVVSPVETSLELISRLIADRSTSTRHLLIQIARCESGIRHFKDDGTLLYSHYGTPDVGLYQINETYHLKASRDLGFDIYDPEGNVRYALYLFDQSGTAPWNASKPCWQK